MVYKRMFSIDVKLPKLSVPDEMHIICVIFTLWFGVELLNKWLVSNYIF